jgi:ribosomal protein S8E
MDPAFKPVFVPKKKRQEQLLQRQRDESIERAKQREDQRKAFEKQRNRSRSRSPPLQAISQEERNLIKAQFLGNNQERKKKSLPTDGKHKFVFDWDPKEDTSSNALPSVKLVRKLNTDLGDGGPEHLASRLSKLKDEEMTTRDWRIFREN